MARDQIDMTPIETRDELVAWFEAGNKPKAQFRVGTEHEKFAFTIAGHTVARRTFGGDKAPSCKTGWIKRWWASESACQPCSGDETARKYFHAAIF